MWERKVFSSSEKDIEILINEIVDTSYRMLDIKLRKNIYELFTEKGEPITDEVIKGLLPLWWQSYAQWN